MTAIEFAERGWLPDAVIRYGIKRLLQKRLSRETSKENNYTDIVKAMSEGPLAIKTDLANDQHYEVPSTFFEIMLGKALDARSVIGHVFWLKANTKNAQPMER